MIHSLFLALLDLFFLGPKLTSHKPRFGTEQTAGLRPTDSVLQLCEAVVKEMGEKSGSVVSHSLIFQSQAAAESVGGWGVGTRHGYCEAWYTDPFHINATFRHGMVGPGETAGREVG